MAFKPFVRRSHLLVPVLDQQAVEASWTHDADAVMLDLGDTGPGARRAVARDLVKRSIEVAGRGAAEVFIRIDRDLGYADLDGCVWPGLTGIVYPSPESALDILELDQWLTNLEKLRGIPRGGLQIVILLGTGKGVWNIREISKASQRVCSVGLDELLLCQDLSILPDPAFDPFVYAKGRTIVEARAAGIHPVGIRHPYGLFLLPDDLDELYQIAFHSKNMGFAGTFCTTVASVGPCNRAFTPSLEQVERYQQTRRLFGEAVARGTAAVPFPGTTIMIDVPVDERARLMLEHWERCVARDKEKADAVARAKFGGAAPPDASPCSRS